MKDFNDCTREGRKSDDKEQQGAEPPEKEEERGYANEPVTVPDPGTTPNPRDLRLLMDISSNHIKIAVVNGYGGCHSSFMSKFSANFLKAYD